MPICPLVVKDSLLECALFIYIAILSISVAYYGTEECSYFALYFFDVCCVYLINRRFKAIVSHRLEQAVTHWLSLGGNDDVVCKLPLSVRRRNWRSCNLRRILLLAKHCQERISSDLTGFQSVYLNFFWFLFMYKNRKITRGSPIF